MAILREKSLNKNQEIIKNTNLKILQAINSTYSLEEICDYLYKTVKEIIDIKNFYVAIYDKLNHSLSFPYYIDEYNTKPIKRKFGNGLTEYVIKTKEILLLNDKIIDEKISEGIIVPSNISVKGWLGVPLFIHDDIAGAIVIKEYQRENFLDDNIKQIIELVSYPISRVIERAIIDQTRKNFTQKLQELNNSKDKFFSIISHDLKSPFNSILGFTEILKEQNESLTKEDLQQIYDSLYNSARKTFNLLNNLLQYSRFQTGLEEFNPSEINLLDVVEENLALFEGAALKKQIKIINNINNNSLIYADKEMLNSILRNLINNAIKFTYPGGQVFIYSLVNDNYMKISVKDSGVGMDIETINNLFKLESKKSNPGTNKEEGTGLGLILVKEFVERNGGKIFVDSKIGVGSEFSFTVKSYNSYN
ncbi:MAG: GAF domain-containing sensor histidine kinase [Bacteroidetes bacterium]|nr:GAF domain-containing sensor histidine kinase [Bacteroidota bacterium]